MTTKRTPQTTDEPPFLCEYCQRPFDTPLSRRSHYRWCKERTDYEPPPSKKRDYTQNPATQRQRRNAACKHGDRSHRSFAATPCTEDTCNHPDGHPREFREGVTEQGAWSWCQAHIWMTCRKVRAMPMVFRFSTAHSSRFHQLPIN